MTSKTIGTNTVPAQKFYYDRYSFGGNGGSTESEDRGVHRRTGWMLVEANASMIENFCVVCCFVTR